MSNRDFSFYEIVICILLAILGSLAKSASAYIQQRKFQWLEILCNIIVSLFAGILIYMICKYLEFDSLIIAICSSLSGWLGSELIVVLANRLKKEVEDKL